jgi:hypothetical protein
MSDAEEDPTVLVDGKRVMAIDGDMAEEKTAHSLPQRDQEVREQFDRGEYKPALTEATERAVQRQQEGQGVVDPIKKAALIGPGSMTGFNPPADNVALMQVNATKQMVGTVGKLRIFSYLASLTRLKSRLRDNNQGRYPLSGKTVHGIRLIKSIWRPKAFTL